MTKLKTNDENIKTTLLITSDIIGVQKDTVIAYKSHNNAYNNYKNNALHSINI